MNVFVIGVGLIGGSMVLDIQREYPKAVVYGIDASENHLDEAKKIGVIHHKATFSELEKASIVIISIPVDVQIAIIPKVLDIIADDCLVLDVGSTKANICEAIKIHPKRRNFLATHPIAGTEFSGPTAAHENLFKQKTNIICEVEKTAFKLQEIALEIFSKLGMRIRYMDAKSHDKHIAYVSHLSHISSFMLGKTVIEKEKNERDIFDMAGSGFASTVRLAKSSPAMWTAIFKQNKDNVVETLDEYINNLQQFKELILEDDFTEIHNEMESTNHIKQILNGIK
ncbi:prephenate dehydrogenase [Tenacibaculum dicentrarchi]|nr:prephenate dehydrogenase [Tenacibaculum dicentrarchi]MCD8407852.1 prephenate dehydrogenase [Tenacibaculum dicentrarchi]MCD8415091.1 prephenate dehydrogenase [Tenacibaculum dicentrarchi]MCD8420410.1 prephenate dehydrogenase [Tenacibaculum dicentrarchi]MCD8425446.1 prephenate dehydrogenase [Tenacibaculum dicentrarchi]